MFLDFFFAIVKVGAQKFIVLHTIFFCWFFVCCCCCCFLFFYFFLMHIIKWLSQLKPNNNLPPMICCENIVVGKDFVPNPQVVCPLWGQRTRMSLFLQATWAVFEICSHIEKRCVTLMPYKFYLKARVYHYYTCSSGRGMPFEVTNPCSRSKS